MSAPILLTKLFIPAKRPELVSRSRLIEQLNRGLHRKLTLISAPAGFGKTTLVTDWLKASGDDSSSPFLMAWLSLDEGDNDAVRFLIYLISALNRIPGLETEIGVSALQMIQSPQPPPPETILIALINEIALLSEKIVLVMDDYHLIDSQPVHDSLNFLIENLPPQLHLVIMTRVDPPISISRFRARGQLIELRAIDLRFTLEETANFLNQVMRLNLSADDIAVFEARTEGWIAGLQLAALSMQGRDDAHSFIQSFAGSNRMVLDYLMDEVLEQQSAEIQNFLLQTAILERMTGSLCDAVTGQDNSQVMLEILERANLFIIPLDNDRQWYRYHHLFADLLQQRLHQSAASSIHNEGMGIDELHLRASQWYEENGLGLEAFHHAVAANDDERAAHLVEKDGIFLQFVGTVVPVLNWLESLPSTILDAKPSLWVMYASTLTKDGRLTSVEPKLKAAEKALEGSAANDKTRDLIGRIASIRATLAVMQGQIETIIVQSRRALEYLHPDNLSIRSTTIWTMGCAYHLQGDRAAAGQAYAEAISMSQMIGNVLINIMASSGLGSILEAENQLNLAVENYRRVLQLAGDPPMSVACEAYLGLARVHYEWNDLDTAKQHAQQGVRLGRQVDHIDTPAACELILARMKLAQGDVAGAATIVAKADQFVRQHNFMFLMPDVAAVQVLTLLRQVNLTAAAHLAEKYELPLSMARVHLAQGAPTAALAVLAPYRQAVEAKDWKDERLKVMVLQAIAHLAHGEEDVAVQFLGEALALAESGGFVRVFIDEGPPMARLLFKAAEHELAPTYIQRLLAAFPILNPTQAAGRKSGQLPPKLIEQLSDREIEVLRLVAEGLSRQEIAAKLVLSLNTVKTHVRNIYSKLGVNNQMQAVGKARALGLLENE